MERIIKIKDNLPAAVASASKALKAGKVVATPTDTVYGLASSVQNKNAVRELYKIKGRDFSKPIAICVGEIEQVFKWSHLPWMTMNGNSGDGDYNNNYTKYEELLNDLLPGPVTCLFRRSPDLNPEFNPSSDYVGIRIPDHDFIRAVCREFGEPIALTSANKSAQPSSTKVEDFQCLFDQIDTIFDDDDDDNDDEEKSRAGSTIIDLSTFSRFKIVRDGCALEETLKILSKHDITSL